MVGRYRRRSGQPSPLTCADRRPDGVGDGEVFRPEHLSDTPSISGWQQDGPAADQHDRERPAGLVRMRSTDRGDNQRRCGPSPALTTARVRGERREAGSPRHPPAPKATARSVGGECAAAETPAPRCAGRKPHAIRSHGPAGAPSPAAHRDGSGSPPPDADRQDGPGHPEVGAYPRRS